MPSQKKLMMTVFWDCDGVILINYLPKNVNINNVYYSNLLCNDLRAALKNKIRGKLTSIPLLQQDNATSHTASLTVNTVQQMGWTLLPHPSTRRISPLAISTSALKKPLRGNHFADADEMKTAVTQWVKDTPREFFRNGIRNLQHRWSKCISLKGEYIEKFDIDSDDE